MGRTSVTEVIQDSLSEIKDIILAQKQRIAALAQATQNKSYADISSKISTTTKRRQNIPPNVPNVRVTPAAGNEQIISSEDIKNAFLKHVDPRTELLGLKILASG